MKTILPMGNLLGVVLLALCWSHVVPASAEALDHPDNASRLRAFSLTDSHGEAVTERSFRGDWLIVFFGFTNCPDTCPAGLFKLSKALEGLGSDASHVRVAFISIDPDRDSPQTLKNYLEPFGPRFVGLTGSSQQITSAEHTFRAYAQKQSPAKDGSYRVDHSSTFYVIDPHGQFQRQMSAESAIADLTVALRNALRSGAG